MLSVFLWKVSIVTEQGLLAKERSLSDMFNILPMQDLAQLLENNSKILQSSTLTAEQALTGIETLYIRLQELRKNLFFRSN